MHVASQGQHAHHGAHDMLRSGTAQHLADEVYQHAGSDDHHLHQSQSQDNAVAGHVNFVHKEGAHDPKSTTDPGVHSAHHFLALEKAKEMYGMMPKPLISAPEHSDLTTRLRNLAESHFVSFVVFSAVALNGIQMGLQTDYSSEEIDNIFWILDNLFTAIFAAEMGLKIAAYRFEYFRDKWNLFDFSLSWMSIIDMWILGAIGNESGGMKMLAVLRVLRVLRAVRLLRVLRSLRELALIVEGIASATKVASWACLLFILLIYIFAIFCCRAVGQEGIYESWDPDTSNYPEVNEFNSYQYFGTMPRTMFTLLQVAMLADDWSYVSRAVLEKQPVVLLVFIMFIAFTTFGLLNVISGIIVESVMSSAANFEVEEERTLKKEILHKLESLSEFVYSLDLNGDHTIDAAEMHKAWERPEMQEFLNFVHLPLGADIHEFVDLVDTDGKGVVDTHKLVGTFVRMLTNEVPQTLWEMKAQQNRFQRELKNLQVEVSELPAKIDRQVGAEVRELKAMLRAFCCGEPLPPPISPSKVNGISCSETSSPAIPRIPLKTQNIPTPPSKLDFSPSSKLDMDSTPKANLGESLCAHDGDHPKSQSTPRTGDIYGRVRNLSPRRCNLELAAAKGALDFSRQRMKQQELNERKASPTSSTATPCSPSHSPGHSRSSPGPSRNSPGPSRMSSTNAEVPKSLM